MRRGRKGSHCLLYISDGVVDLESLGDLLGSNRANIIMNQADSERHRDEMRGEEKGRGQPLLTI
jgi:hypothetical protein